MRITFIGATHEVTGSCTLLEVNNRRILVDCGMEQGKDIFENQEIPVNPSLIDAVLLTHAHVDHSGNLPLLYKQGFRGRVYATAATCDLCNIMLRDCAHIQEQEAEWRNRKAKRSGKKQYEPLYDINDVEGLLSKMVRSDYNDPSPIAEGVTICFKHVGHLLGAASIEVTLTEGDETRKLVFSGDIGNVYQPLISDQKEVTDADYVIMESTYGDRLHSKQTSDPVIMLAKFLQDTFDKGGNVVIPSFAVGRTQEILYYIRQIKKERLVTPLDFPVYMDSPLANEATSIFLQCDEEYLDEATCSLIHDGINPIIFPGLTAAVSSDQSKAINFDSRPKVILSASGMCEAGRVRHHLKHNLWRKDSLILFVGYQSVGTLGRSLADGVKKVKLFGEEISVGAAIGIMEGTSGHADRNGLYSWLCGFAKKPKTVFVIHGDDDSCTSFTKLLKEEHGYNATAPYSGTCYDLITGQSVELTEGIPVKKSVKKPNTVYDRLLTSGERMMALIRESSGVANKELARLADQIDAMCDKFSKY